MRYLFPIKQFFFFFLTCSLAGFLALDLRDFKELYCPIKRIMIEEILKILQMAKKKDLLWKFLKHRSQLMKYATHFF